MFVFRQQRLAFLRRYVLPLLVAALILMAANIYAVRSIRHHYFILMEEQAITFAESYAHSLVKSGEAQQTIENLLNHHLLAAGQTIASYDFLPTGDRELEELAAIMGVDVIYLYDQDGTVIHSTGGKYIGWQTYPGHPVYDFWQGLDQGHVEAIRPDSESGELFKYAYFMNPDGGFVQLGIATTRVQGFLGTFETDQLLREIAEQPYVNRVLLWNGNLNAVASGDGTIPGESPSASLQKILNRGEILTGTDLLPDIPGFQVLVPIKIGEVFMGTLVISHTMERVNRLIRRASQIMGVTSLVVFFILLVSLWLLFRQNSRLISLAYIDSRTGLPNRAYLTELLQDRLQAENRESCAVLLVDCSNFTSLTLTFGYQYSDSILQTIGDRLQAWPHAGQRWIRFRAAQFMLLVDQYPSQRWLADLANSIEPFLRGYEVDNVARLPAALELRVGIVEVTDSYTHANDVFRDASIALRPTDSPTAFSSYQFFHQGFRDQLNRSHELELQMRRALDNDPGSLFSLQYQPKIAAKSGEVVGFEALARLYSPTLESVPPLEFIPLAERSQLIQPLGLWVLREATNFATRLSNLGRGDVTVAVNVSGLQLLQPGFADDVKIILLEAGLTPNQLELEITESVFLEQPQIAVEVLAKLRELGIRTAIDDFGTGYSSLARLRDLPMDAVKLDRSFIWKIDAPKPESLIVAELIALCHKIDLQVVAEGVETTVQEQYLVAKKCDVLQGFLFSRPLDEAQALTFVDNKSGTTL